MRRAFFVAVAVVVSVGCQGGGDPPAAPVLAITAPVPDQQVTGGRTVTVTGTVSGGGTLAVAVAVNGGTAVTAQVASGAFSADVTLADGANTITATVTGAGGSTSASVEVTYVPAPTIAITAPAASQQVTGSRTVTVSGTVAGQGALTVALSVNGGVTTPATVLAGTFSGTVSLPDGACAITATVTGTGGSTPTSVQVTYVPAPTIAITSPTPSQQFTGTRAVTVSGTVGGQGTLAVALSANGGATTPATVLAGTFGGTVALADGSNSITATVTGPGGSTAASVQVTYVPPPTIAITSPTPSQQITGSRAITVTGTAAGAGLGVVAISLGSGAPVSALVVGGAFSAEVALADGTNTITAAVTGTGGSTAASVPVTYVPPPTIAVTSPTASQQFTGSRAVTVSGTVGGQGTLTVELAVNGGTAVTATVTGTTFSGTVALADGSSTITATVTGTGGSTPATVQVTYVPAPTIAITSPTPSQQFTGTRTVTVSGTVAGQGTLTVALSVNGGATTPAAVLAGTFSGTVSLPDGASTVTATVTGTGGSTPASVQVSYVPAPTIAISSPSSGERITGSTTLNVTGTVGGAGPLSVALQVNAGPSIPAAVSGGTFSGDVELPVGTSALVTATVTGTGGNAADSVSVLFPYLALTDFQDASLVLGQPDFESGLPNRGGSQGLDTLNNPYGAVAWDGTTLYVPDFQYWADTSTGRVLGFTGFPTTNGAAASFVIGQGSGPASATTWGSPVKLQADGGKLFVTDWSFDRVLVVDPAPAAAGAAATLAIGQLDLTTHDLAASESGLNQPEGMWIVSGKLIVADTMNNRVLIWNTVPTTSGQPADLVLGQADFASTEINAGGAPSARTFYWPNDVWSDGTRLYVADGMNNRVLGWSTFPTVSQQAADFVLGQPGFASHAASTGPAGLSGPYRVSSNGNQLFVTDTWNERVLIWNTLPTTTAASADRVLGQASFTDVSANAGGPISARSLFHPDGILVLDDALVISDSWNHRVLVYRP